mmetsp:Transcript_24736/g.46846  ORF Transcript_24736/g.46846 Transcript_24736/m.46846 type:complete len:263 (-) Transcript_24736:117-905(-)|eukprot:CAMPEP_0114262726 /NCGR_PEP_ID=MMETSP0058-20121206/22000_1 /TAXON_ID=36894 /ORGANISM="Pyramimonas parkeae, CCMP726" /LENGTH=262 /DNA_ID=CAMNT_0001378699 /DNA_START=167 /DNA_END=955 /DNA_ORIENTATION=-
MQYKTVVWSIAVALFASMANSSEISCAGCTLLTEIFADALLKPHPSIKSQMVPTVVDGKVVQRPYSTTDQYVSDVVSYMCNTTLLSAYRRTESWLGEIRYEESDIPQYSSDSMWIDPQLKQVCDKLFEKHKDFLVVSTYARKINEVCSHHSVKACGAKSQQPVAPWMQPLDASRLFLQRIQEDPTALLKVMPLLVMLVSVPFLFLSMIRGNPDPVFSWDTKYLRKEPAVQAGTTNIADGSPVDIPEVAAKQRKSRERKTTSS